MNGGGASAAASAGPDPESAGGTSRIAVRIAERCRIGARPHNEDRLAVLQLGEHWCLVLSDGAGGHGEGGRAAQLVVERVLAGFRSRPPRDAADLAELLLDAHDAVVAAQRQRPASGDAGGAMQATVVALLLDVSRGRALWGHVGDSRLYRWRAGRLDAVTRDDSVRQSLLDAAGVGASSAPGRLPGRNVLIAALGACEEAQPHVVEPVVLEAADAFLLCSDGWWDGLEPQAMSAALSEAATPGDWLDAMAVLIERRADPRQDNYSAIACWIGMVGEG
ncbi:MAG TPA: protein phosphatase 2C domain-containing protein [Steroidobacteraceae bacterium]|nr:protein phosphatase 2C domain-containing protein [Steroidobacteraceae bacterium]